MLHDFSFIIKKLRGEGHKDKVIHMKRHYLKLQHIVLCFLTPETYPNYPLSHHPSSFPLTVEKR